MQVLWLGLGGDDPELGELIDGSTAFIRLTKPGLGRRGVGLTEFLLQTFNGFS